MVDRHAFVAPPTRSGWRAPNNVHGPSPGGSSQCDWGPLPQSPADASVGHPTVALLTGGSLRDDELVEDLSRRCAELEHRAAELEQANRELAGFAADAAHDLRAPVQVITGFAELLARREGARLDETSQQFLGHILGAALGMRELVESVLDHRQSSSAELAVGPVDCQDLIMVILQRLRAELDEADAEVEIYELPTVLADRVQLGRVFQNLLSNALKAAAPDRHLRIVISARRLAGGWEFSVTDNGIGVPSEDRERIFELFQRGPAAGRNGRGLGLGLAICRAVVERHGGCIGHERAPGGGSRFAFSLRDSTPAP